ncbi:MAG: flagellar hook-associated 3 family protein [Methylocystis sp.]|nr:MAG: flagellar hook-associated 3 family protein [Methylocystis sp.]
MTYTTSTFSLTAALRGSINSLQRDLARGQKELSTGRHADPGVALGAQTSRSFALASTQSEVASIRSTNKLVAARLEATQTALGNLLDGARSMRATLLAAQTDGGEPSAIVTQARGALSTVVATLNGSDGEAFLFAGVNSNVAPLENYFANPPGSSKRAVDAAFAATFGIAQDDPAVGALTRAQIENFLNGPFEQLFTPTQWRADWSKASDEPLHSRIAISMTVDASVSANEKAFRQLATAYTMIADLGAQRMSKPAYHAVLETAMQTIDASIDALTRTKARVGATQASIETADAAMAIQSETLELQRNALEGIDQTQAAARLKEIMAQTEMAFTLTARISQLTLAKYL